MAEKRQRHPQVSLKVMRDKRPDDTDKSKDGYDKRSVILRVADAEENTPGNELLSQTTFVPSDEELEKINGFTQRRVSADEVACFTTLSCNDLPDRDDDQFVTQTVKGLAALAPPYSPTGKSFMVSHDTSKLAVGRIFDTDTTKAKMPTGDDVMFLRNKIYIPRIAANETFIQNQEFGVNWAVSVGVLMGDAKCNVGKEHDWGWWPWFCQQGHDKGLSYDPDSDEEDDWGYPLPVAANAKNAQKCLRLFYDPKDMYELSQVYLGAQYFAEIAKQTGFAPIMKSAKTIPVLGLRREEAKGLQFPGLPEPVAKAQRNHTLSEDDDGVFTWSDDNDLVWRFAPGIDSGPLCLGRSSRRSKMAPLVTRQVAAQARFDKIKEEKDTAGAGALAGQLQGSFDELSDAIDNDDDETAEILMDRIEGLIDDLFDELYENDNTDEPDDDNPAKSVGDDMSKKVVMAKIAKVGLPDQIVSKVEASDDATALDVLVTEAAAHIKSLAAKGAAGDAYLKELRTEVIDLYVKAKTIPGSANGAVDVSPIEKILRYVDSDPDALKALRDEYFAALQAKFPAAVRRSSFETDANSPKGVHPIDEKDIMEKIDLASIKRIHG